MKKIAALLLCALLALLPTLAMAELPLEEFFDSAPEEHSGDSGFPEESGEGITIDVNGESVRLAFDASPMYSSAQGGMIQASYYAYGSDGVTLYELYLNFPETARAGMVITPEYEAMTNGNSSVSLIVSQDDQNMQYYFSSLADGTVYPDDSTFSIAIDGIETGVGGTTYSGRLSATLIALDIVSGQVADTLEIPETPFTFTMGGSGSPDAAPAPTPVPSDMRKV